VGVDRSQSREKALEALKSGATDVTQPSTPVVGALAGGGPAANDLSISADHDSIPVGGIATLIASFSGQPMPSEWTCQPQGVVSLMGTGPNADLVVTGSKAGTVTISAKWTNTNPPPPIRTGTKTLVVTAKPSSSISFPSLGAGVGTAILALLAVSGGIALAFEGTFTAEIGTLLGTALGAGAVGTASAISHSSGTQSPTAPKQD